MQANQTLLGRQPAVKEYIVIGYRRVQYVKLNIADFVYSYVLDIYPTATSQTNCWFGLSVP